MNIYSDGCIDKIKKTYLRFYLKKIRKKPICKIDTRNEIIKIIGESIVIRRKRNRKTGKKHKQNNIYTKVSMKKI